MPWSSCWSHPENRRTDIPAAFVLWFAKIADGIQIKELADPPRLRVCPYDTDFMLCLLRSLAVLLIRVFSARLRRSGLVFACAGATSLGCELPINFLNREGLGIEIAADPVVHFLMLFMVGIGEGVEEFIKPRDASTVVRRTRETSIDTDWDGHIRQERQQLLEDDCVLPVITEIVGVDELGAEPSEHITEPNIAFVFYLHPHANVIRVRSPEAAFPGSEFVHVAVVPTHGCLQNIMQFGQGHRRWDKQAPPDRRFCAE